MGSEDWRLYLCFMLAFAAVEEEVDVLLSHQVVLFRRFSGVRTIGGLVELRRAVFP